MRNTEENKAVHFIIWASFVGSVLRLSSIFRTQGTGEKELGTGVYQVYTVISLVYLYLALYLVYLALYLVYNAHILSI